MTINNKASDLGYEMTHPDLLASKQLVYNACHIHCSLPKKEVESAEYGAYFFKLNNSSVQFRVAKTTPAKLGQFVTLWKRVGDGPIQPYDASDQVDLFIISTRQGARFGQFIFPSIALCEQGIVSKQGQDGKRAIRVYPPWIKPQNRQASKTQRWQLLYFLEIPQSGLIDCVRAKHLLLANTVK